MLILRTLGFGDWIQRVTRARRPHQPEARGSGLPTIAALLAKPEPAQTYLPDHLLEHPILVPPALFAKRWIVFNTPADLGSCIRGFVLDFQVDERERERVWVPIDSTGSEWQERDCTPQSNTAALP